MDSCFTGSSSQTNILDHFKPQSQEHHAGQNEAGDNQKEAGDEMAEGDWLDDIEGLFDDDDDDDDPDAPWPPKRQKT